MIKYGRLIPYNKFTDYIIHQMKKNGLGDIDLREAVKLERRAWRNKKQNPSELTLAQINTLAQLLKVERELLIKLALDEKTNLPSSRF